VPELPLYESRYQIDHVTGYRCRSFLGSSFGCSEIRMDGRLIVYHEERRLTALLSPAASQQSKFLVFIGALCRYRTQDNEGR
jgi:hypothetical protein